jgi:HlyD family secretion protein
LPARDAQLAPQVSGRIASLEVREGDRVAKNQVVARIDMATLSDVVSQAEAAVSRAHAERKNAETTLERNQKVFERGIAARQELDDALTRAAAAQASEADAVAVSSQARRQLDRALLRSPLDGVVVRLFRKPGELVDGTPATVVLEVADLSRLELAVDAPVQELVRVTPGDRASVTFSALPEVRLPASVVVVAPSVDKTSGLGVIRLDLATDGGRGPPVGTLGLAHIQLGATGMATWVPAQALRNVLGDEGEVVACDGTARVLRVTPLERDAEWVAVTGLDAGVQVVVEHLLGIREGDALEVDP